MSDKDLNTEQVIPHVRTSPSDNDETATKIAPAIKSIVPGVLFCLGIATLAWFLARLLPNVSALLIAIVVGAVWRNVAPIPKLFNAGIAFSAKKLLRTGIVLLGLQLSLGSILNLGWWTIFVVVFAVAVTFFTTLWVGSLLGLPLSQRLLIASGFSICGAAAVAATEGPAQAKKEEVATALALVVLFGTLMIPFVPFVGNLLGMSEEDLGFWIGASTHEVAQVVAAGGAVGTSAVAIAVVVKLARVITLAPVIAGISLYMRRQGSQVGTKKPPIVPLFVVGFLVAVLLRSMGFLPEPLLAFMEIAQTLLLSAAMFALGLGVHLPTLFKVGVKPIILGVVSTAVILVVSLVAISSYSTF